MKRLPPLEVATLNALAHLDQTYAALSERMSADFDGCARMMLLLRQHAAGGRADFAEEDWDWILQLADFGVHMFAFRLAEREV